MRTKSYLYFVFIQEGHLLTAQPVKCSQLVSAALQQNINSIHLCQDREKRVPCRLLSLLELGEVEVKRFSCKLELLFQHLSRNPVEGEEKAKNTFNDNPS